MTMVVSKLAVGVTALCWAAAPVEGVAWPATRARANVLLRVPRRAAAPRMGFVDDVLKGAGELQKSVELSLSSSLAQVGKQAARGSARAPPPPPPPPVVIKEDYTLAIAFVLGGVALTTGGAGVLNGAGALPGVLVLLLGILFTVQTGRIRFTFDETAFELKTRAPGTDTDGSSPAGLRASGDNIVVGGANRWAYDTFVNYAFFPAGWLERGWHPILVYFKETQTPSDQWDVGPGQSANSPQAVALGAVRGQVHFFPALCDCDQLSAQFESRGCAKLPTGAK
jgi:hypothetical protein